ncbi:MAG: hypothetical protein AAGF94_03745 [Pseudomonadota bacterium]
MARSIFPHLAGVFGLLAAWPALAADTLSCGTFTLEQRIDDVHFISDDSNSVKPGDRRVLVWDLLHPSGEKAGRFNVVTTVIGPVEGGNAVTADGALVFENGSIFATGQGVLVDPSDTTRSNPKQVQWAITGGLRAFANATGIITATPPPAGENAMEHWTFEVSAACGG